MKTRALRTLLSSLLCLALLATFSTSSAQAPDLRAAGPRVRPAVGESDPSMAPERSKLLVSEPPPPGGEDLETMQLPPGALSLPAGFAADVPASRDPKLDSAMAALVAAAQVSLEEALDLARSQALRLSGSRVHVQISVRAQGVDNAIQAVARAGGEVTGVGNKNTLIQGWLPIDALEAVAAHHDVYLIRRPAEVVLLGNLHAPNATTEGLAVINGPAWHTAGHTGAGVKVGVIDGGFEGYTGLLGTDLPASVTVKNFVDGEDDSQVDGTTKHGTACAEIIHDIVPGATFYLAKVSTNVDLQEAAAWLKDTHQVDIISTSLGWYNLTPGDGTGEFADLVQDARDNGILWVTAAGNDREAHWGGTYADADSDSIHEFNGKEINCFGPGDGTCYSLNSGFQFVVFLRWDDWTNVNQDYDLVLLRWNGSGWDSIGIGGTDTQDGSPGQAPREFALGITSDSATAYGFAILRNSSTRAVNFELFVPKFARPDEILHARSLSNLADAPDAMTVAALDVTSPYPQESYSSEGPTNGPGGTAAGGFTKPDISGFANVSTESYGAGGFNGTSSATPHVAGAAALVLSAYPSYTPDQLQSFLEGRAVDMGSVGMDPLFGYGRLHLGDPPGAANTAPTISGLPDQVVPVNGSLHPAIDLWAYASDAEDADGAMTYTISNTPDPNAGVSIDSNRYVDINPTPGWTGVTDVEVQVEDTGGLTDADEFRVSVFSGKTWDGSVNGDWHNADNWTPAGVPTSGDDVLIPDVTNDPVISSGDAAANSIIISEGAVLDLTGRTLTVEGTLTNNGSLKQTQAAVGGSTSNFLRITNLAGTQTKYYGVDITPSSIASTMTELAAERLTSQSEPSSTRPLKGNGLARPTAPSADVALIVDDGTQENNLVLRDPNTQTEFHAVLFNHFTATLVPSFPFTLERIDIHENTNNLEGEDIQLLVYTDADGGDPSNATLRYNEIVTVQTQMGWNVYTLTNPVAISSSADILVGFSTYYADGGVPWPFEDRYPYPMDETDPKGGSYAAWMNETYDPVDPSDLSSFDNLEEMGNVGYPCNWMIRGYGSLGTLNASPIISGLPDQTVPMNGSADNAIDLWAYASDAEDADSVMTYTISNSPTISAGVAITINRYIDIDPAADWTGVTDVEIQVQDTGGLTDTDTFQVTVGDVPNIEVVPASFEETLVVDEVCTATLTISNTGTAILPFWFDAVAVPWLSVDPAAGAVSAGGSQPVDVIFDATGQSLGDYSTDLVINSTDPDDDPVTVPVTMHVSGTLNTPPTMSGLPDQAVGMNGSIDNAIDLWAYANDAEDADADLAFSIINSPDPNAGVTVDSDRYIDINPATDWTGVADVEVQVQDTGGLTDTDTFQVAVSGSLVSVTVYGNQLCSGRTSGVRRCFDVDTTAAMSATVRFYFSEAERNDKQLDDLVVFHYNGGWAKEPGPYTRGGTGDAQYVEAQNVDGFSLFALDTGATAVYLPMVLKHWPPIPDTPVLNAISNSDNDGNYTVSWQAVNLADTYVLQEDDNSSFSSPTQVYEGSSTSRSVTGQSPGTYYYRVKAINNWEGQQLESGWSNVRSVKVSPPTRFYPSSDTAVLQGAPTSSYGGNSTMLVGYAHSGCLGWDGKIARSLVKFDLSDIPAGTSISEARLYLRLVGACYYTGHTQSRTVTLYRNTANWTSSATWNTRPSYAEACGSASVSVTAWGYKSFNVTNVVRNWINNTQPNYGFTVRAPEGSGSEFALLEFATMNASGTSYDPYLQITYTGMADSKEDEVAVEVIPEPVPCRPGAQDALGTFLGPSGYSASGFVRQTVCSSE